LPIRHVQPKPAILNIQKKTAPEEVSVAELSDVTTRESLKSAFASDKNTPLSDIFARLSGMNSAQES
jgi:hypothetical protein